VLSVAAVQTHRIQQQHNHQPLPLPPLQESKRRASRSAGICEGNVIFISCIPDKVEGGDIEVANIKFLAVKEAYEGLGGK